MAFCIAACCAASGCSAELLDAIIEASCVVNFCDIADSRASFSGFGGIGGGGMFADCAGRGGSNGELSKSSRGALGWCCGA